MKTSVALFLVYLSSALAAPAVVWKNSGEKQGVLRTSDSRNASDLLADVLSTEAQTSSLASVVFLVGRGADGSESLSTMASSGSLPNVAQKYELADAVHHHISGMESSDSLVRDAVRANPGHNVLSVSLNELNIRLESSGPQVVDEMEVSQNGLLSKAKKFSQKRSKKLHEATVLIVKVDPNTAPSDIDSAVLRTIENQSIESVVLTAVRSHAEVKHERAVESQRRLKMMEKAGEGVNKKMHGRRLEDMQQDEGENNNNNQNNNNGNNDMTGVYYVSMTPNILAGILFFLMFTTVTWIGVSCMGMIQGQDVYVSKLPPVGREA